MLAWHLALWTGCYRRIRRGTSALSVQDQRDERPTDAVLGGKILVSNSPIRVSLTDSFHLLVCEFMPLDLRKPTAYGKPMPKRDSNPYGVWHELRVLRTKDGQSITSLAAQAQMSLSHLSDLERGRQLPSAEVVRKLAVALNVPRSVLERDRRTDDAGNSVALRDLIREVVIEVLAEQQVA